MRSVLSAAAFAAGLALTRAQGVFQPSQVHISFPGQPGAMGVDFVTDDNVACNATGVAWGLSPSALDTFVPAASCYFFTGVGFLNQVLLTSLPIGSTVYYVAGSQTAKNWAWSTVHSFNVLDTANTTASHVAAIYADFGLYNQESLQALMAASYEGRMDFIIHAGDFAYDLDAGTPAGQVGNDFMLSIEPIAASMPYMPSAGNHEVGSNFSHYKNRFAALQNFTGAASGSPSNHFYSFDVGPVHYIAIDTEVYDEFQGWDLPDNMLRWLQADLEKANARREEVPWVVAYGHKAHYMAGNSSQWEQLFYDLGVDLFFCGHVHSYSRWLPWNPYTDKYDTNTTEQLGPDTYVNPSAVVTIVSGAPGNQEVNAGRQCSPLTKGGQSTYCSNYGFGYLEVFNATHAHWRWETAVPLNGTSTPDYADDLWVITDTHGPRSH